MNPTVSTPISGHRRLRPPASGMLIAFSVLAGCTTGYGAASPAKPPSVTVGMPFTGTWAYNAPVQPPYTDANSSHPSVHKVHSSSGQWATDLYASADTPVKLYLSSKDGPITLTVRNEWDSCGAGVAGHGIAYNVSVAGQYLGWLSYAHLDNVDTAPPRTYTKPFTVGTITREATVAGCFETTHTHLELGADRNAPPSCWIDIGRVGVGVQADVPVARLGSTNSKTGQACPEEGVSSTGSLTMGRWAGTIRQNNVSPFRLVLTLRTSPLTGPNRVEIPASGCVGTVRYRSLDATGSYVFLMTWQHGNCLDGTMWLKVDNATTMSYRWADGHGRYSSGPLRRSA